MAEKETFEAQAAAVQRLLDENRSQLSTADQRHLACAVRNLEQLGRVRGFIVAQAADIDGPTDASDALMEQLIKLLHLPTGT